MKRKISGGNRGLWLMMASLLLLLTACNRRADDNGFRMASTTSPADANNASTENTAPVSPAVPGVSYADVVSRVAPAVVTIHSRMRMRQPQQYPFMDDPFFRRFFGNRNPQEEPGERRREGVGSGVIVSQDGYIVTNHHVVDGADQIRVDLTDGRTFEAKVVGLKRRRSGRLTKW